MKSKKAAVVVAAVTLLVYFLTSSPATRPLVNSLFILYIFVAGAGIMYWPFAREALKDDLLQSLYFFAIFSSMLFWIGVTGWFFSPFFYLLYLLAIMISFMFSPFTTFIFVIVLLGLFSPNIGSIDLTIDIVTMVSLFSVVPLTYFLQKEYLQLKQAEKKVLILEEQSRELKNKVDEVLMNKVVKFAVDVRQPVNDMRQLAMVALKSQKVDKAREALKKIADLGEKSLDQIESFEEAVTGKKLVHTRKNSSRRAAKSRTAKKKSSKTKK